MRKLVVLASVAALAMIGANCAQDSVNNPSAPSNVVGLSGAVPAETSQPLGKTTRSGGGKKGGGGTTGGSSTLTLQMVNDLNGDGLPNWGDSITWQISTTATAEPNVSVTCSQNGTVVYGAVSGYYASYPAPWTQTMSLASTMWQGGTANCVATLYYFSGTSQINLASMTFTAGA